MDPSWQCSYADDIHLYKPINHPGDYIGLQSDIDATYTGLQYHQLFNIESSQMQKFHLFNVYLNQGSYWLA